MVRLRSRLLLPVTMVAPHAIFAFAPSISTHANHRSDPLWLGKLPAENNALNNVIDDGEAAIAGLVKSRRAFVWGAFSSFVTSGLVLSPGGEATVAHAASPDKVDYNAVARDIVTLINDSKGVGWGPEDQSIGPTLIRLAWHSSGTYTTNPHDPPPGGPRGTIRFKQELDHGANAGLENTAARWMEEIHKKYAGLSYADLYTLGGVVAVKTLGGPTIPWGYGRIDGEKTDIPPEGRLPAPATPPGSPASGQDADHLREIFYRMGFDDREIVALSGAHAVGRCHVGFSGYDGPWQFRETAFDNSYYQLLSRWWAWSERRWDGPTQYRLLFTRPDRVMMLPTDIILVRDRNFRKWVRKYARDEELWFSDFSDAFGKLITLGTSGLTPVELNIA